MKRLVSIIVPVYNSMPKLVYCINSIINQTYKNIEVILIDDGSMDKSGEICDSYAKKDKRIKVIHKKNGGVSSARNYGLELATGDYISFVDSDDYIEKNMIKKMLDNIEKNKAKLAICNISFEDESNEIIMNYNHNNILFNRDEYPKMSYFITSISGYACNKMYSKDLIFSSKSNFIRFDSNISIGEDNLFNYHIYDKNKNFNCCYINDKLYHYVLNKYSASGKKINLKKLSFLDVRNQEIKILEKNKTDNNFLKADYVINFIRMRIMMKKSNITLSHLNGKLFDNYKKYKSEIKIAKLPRDLKIKYLTAVYFPFIYKIKLRNQNN